MHERVKQRLLVGRTCVRLKPLVAVLLGPGHQKVLNAKPSPSKAECCTTYFIEMPYCATFSKPDFHTRVTSQALVAWRRQERKADTALPPTAGRERESARGPSGTKVKKTASTENGVRRTYLTGSSGEEWREPSKSKVCKEIGFRGSGARGLAKSRKRARIQQRRTGAHRTKQKN